ncbi:MAG: sugar phosphate isomerase/epimerase [Acidobacteria bacterium]|nr:sugar phosphate isomerase/epimerase [Acidobacteriota bacterium]
MVYSRRRFGKIALAGVPFSLGFGQINSTVEGVRIGVQTYGFRNLLREPGDPIDGIIQAMTEIGLGECEIFEPEVEPPSFSADAPWAVTTSGKPSQASLYGRPPAGQKPTAAEAATREKIRRWRLNVSLDHFTRIRKKFDAAGIEVFAFYYILKDDCTDREIERGLEMTRALGAKVMTTSATLTLAQRMAPLVKKHQVIVAMHGHSNLADPNQFATPESFAKAVAMSDYYRVNLDIGHFTAAGYDPVAYIRDHHDWITNIHVKDRKKNDGPNTPFGQGDTPIKEVLQLIKTKHFPIPAFIEYEYDGKGSSTEEVRKCFEYVRTALA